MYRNDSATPLFPEFGLPFGGYLNPENRWIKKASLIPWALVEKEYRKHLSGSSTGSPALLARLAFGALLIKEELQLSDQETVRQISENPYLQYLVGCEGFQAEEPFDPSMMVHFRKRFPVDSINRINEAMVLAAQESETMESADSDDPSASNPGKDAGKSLCDTRETTKDKPKNQGKLLLDATCAPADIRYPTDLNLLNEAREKTETIIDCLYKECPKGNEKPRTYRRIARKAYLAVAKKKKPSSTQIRRGIRKQVGYVRRNLGHIQTLAQTVSLSVLKRSLYRDLLVISELYRQQQVMYETRTKRIDDRIVSIWFPDVRPIKRGKAHAETEFGAKVHVSMVNGFAFAERIDWNNFHEGTELKSAIQTYRRRFGCFPQSVHVDKMYRNQDNLKYCRENGIRLSGPALGRPPKDQPLRQEQKKLTRQDERDRIPIEGKFGQGKRKYGLARIMAKLAETSTTVIALNLLVMNLHRVVSTGSFLWFFLSIWKDLQALPTKIRTRFLFGKHCFTDMGMFLLPSPYPRDSQSMKKILFQ